MSSESRSKLCASSARSSRFGARVAERLAQLDYATPLAAAAGALRLAASGDEVGVVLGSTACRLVAPRRARP